MRNSAVVRSIELPSHRVCLSSLKSLPVANIALKLFERVVRVRGGHYRGTCHMLIASLARKQRCLYAVGETISTWHFTCKEDTRTTQLLTMSPKILNSAVKKCLRRATSTLLDGKLHLQNTDKEICYLHKNGIICIIFIVLSTTSRHSLTNSNNSGLQ